MIDQMATPTPAIARIEPVMTISVVIFCTVLGVFFEFHVVVFDGFVCRFDIEIWHLFSPDVVGGWSNAKLYMGCCEIARRILLAERLFISGEKEQKFVKC